MIKQDTMDFSTLPPIVAVDFDGTLVRDNFPEIGVELNSTCNTIRQAQKLGIKTILWTSRTGEHLEAAIKWCEEHNLHFDAVNQNIAEVIALTGQDTRKVYANAYIDDKSMDRDCLELQEHIQGLVKCLKK